MESEALEPTLAAMFPSLGSDDFLREVLHERVLHRRSADLSALAEELLDFDVEALLRRSPGPIHHGIDEGRQCLGAEAATRAWRSGGCRLLRFPAPREVARRWARALEREIGKVDGRCDLYATRGADGATDWHWDANENFVVQLEGAKRWWLLEGDGDSPLLNLALKPGNFRVPPRLRLAYRSNLEPEPDFSRAREIDLRVGDVLYVPNGTWHRVEPATGTTLAFNVVFPPLGLHHGLAALVARLLAMPKWRRRLSLRSVDDVAEARTRLTRLLEELREDLAEVTAHDLLPARLDWFLAGRRRDVVHAASEIDERVGRSTRLRRNPVATLAVAPLASPEGPGLVQVHLGQPRLPPLELSVPAGTLPACRWLDERTTPFVASDVPTMDGAGPATLDVLSVLCAASFLEPLEENARRSW